MDLKHNPYYPAHSSLIKTILSKRRFILIACASLLLLSITCLSTFLRYTESPTPLPPLVTETPEVLETVEKPPEIPVDPYGPKTVLRGDPTLSFRDNLLPNVNYITSWVSAGWTNDVMTYMNLIYLALITDRVAVIPEFIPSHIGGHVPPIPFGEVFDVPRLRTELQKPVLEWWEVKQHGSGEFDELGCWNIWQSVQYRESYPRPSRIPNDLKLDISYTQAPTWVKMIPNYEHDQHSTFWSLATLAFPKMRETNLVPPLPSPQHNVSLPPDEHMLCYDYLYYVCAHQPFELEYDYSPAWRYVGQYMHFTPKLEQLADDYVRRAIGVPSDAPVPPFISIHIRHYDFETWCGDVPIYDCFAPLPVINRRVQEVRDEIYERTGHVIKHVIVTSDERNATWWQEVADLGWYTPDHSTTKDTYGDWYPVLIDAVIQSQGVGFVGTDRSTMSIIAAKRTESWQAGPTRLVLWGNVGADDH